MGILVLPSKTYAPTNTTAKKLYKKIRRPNYAAVLNQTFILLRTKPTNEALKTICDADGLCQKSGACKHPLLFCFFWSLCKERTPGFSNLPCAQEYAKKASFNMASEVFGDGKNAINHLESKLFLKNTPAYMRFMLAKIILQTPQHYLETSEKTRTQICSTYRKLCRYKPPKEIHA